MKELKRIYKRNTRNVFIKGLAGLGRAVNRLHENRNHDLYSNGELTVIQKISKFNPSVIFDGGANIGNYCLVLNKYNPDCVIYAFEPVKSTFDLLCKNTNEYKNIEAVNVGLFSDQLKKEINLYNSNTHSSLFDIKGISRQSTGLNIIDLIRGDDFIDKKKIDKVDFLKLDLEGAEYDAIIGFEKSLSLKKIRAIQFEYGYINITTKKLLIDFYSLLGDYGFIIGKIYPKIVEFRDYKFQHEDFIGPNYIAVHGNDSDLISSLKSRR